MSHETDLVVDGREDLIWPRERALRAGTRPDTVESKEGHP
jgi:hypothetical protein